MPDVLKLVCLVKLPWFFHLAKHVWGVGACLDSCKRPPWWEDLFFEKDYLLGRRLNWYGLRLTCDQRCICLSFWHVCIFDSHCKVLGIPLTQMLSLWTSPCSQGLRISDL